MSVIVFVVILVFASLFLIYFLSDKNTQYSIIQEGVLKERGSINRNISVMYDKNLQEMQNIEEVLGHLRMAQENAQNNNYQLVTAHTSHAINELKNKQYAAKTPQDYLDHLELLLYMIKSSDLKSIDNFEKNIQVVRTAIHEIKISKVGEKLINDKKFQIQTAIYLLELSKIEYGIGLKSGSTFETNVEIQDAYAFTKQAQDILKNSIGNIFTIELDKQIKIIQDVKSLKELEDSMNSTLDKLYGMVD